MCAAVIHYQCCRGPVLTAGAHVKPSNFGCLCAVFLLVLGSPSLKSHLSGASFAFCPVIKEALESTADLAELNITVKYCEVLTDLHCCI